MLHFIHRTVKGCYSSRSMLQSVLQFTHRVLKFMRRIIKYMYVIFLNRMLKCVTVHVLYCNVRDSSCIVL